MFKDSNAPAYLLQVENYIRLKFYNITRRDVDTLSNYLVHLSSKGLYYKTFTNITITVSL
jgi:hypothetical protein